MKQLQNQYIMEKIIDPVPVELLKAELTPDKKLEDTNKGHNELYVVTWHDSPNVLREIGRIREEAFRAEGGSTGAELDLDEYDMMDSPYKQLIVWDPDEEAIIGGYRFFMGPDAIFDENGQPILASSHQFRFSDKFIKNYLPHMIELGRNFVAPEYQGSKAGSRSIFAIDNLWDGLVALIMKNPQILYFFGKITIYPSYDHVSRDLIYHFFKKHYGDTEELIRPWPDQNLEADSQAELMDLVLNNEDVSEDYKLLRNAVRSRGTNIPPNVSAYVALTPSIIFFGTAINRLMHNIEDSAILIPVDDIYQEKLKRHIAAFLRFTVKGMKLDANSEIETQMVQKWMLQRKSYVRRLHRKWMSHNKE